MLAFLFALIERFRARVAASTLDVEADLIIKHAERKAILLRLASRYEAEGLPSVAAEIRQRAEAIAFNKPLAGLFVKLDKAAPVQLEEPHTNGSASTNGDCATPPETPARLIQRKRR